MENIVEFMVTGRYALFCDPITKLGGEKCTYQVPTYQSLKGILESVYWKPTLIWKIDKVRILNPIKIETKSMRPVVFNNASKPDLAIYTYLSDVQYQVQAHFEWNLQREDMKRDRNENKHYFIAKRMIDRGGRRDVFLGTRECQGYVEPCSFGDGISHYDDAGRLNFGIMFHGFDYPDETGRNELVSRFDSIVMEDSVITFTKPEDCQLKRKIRDMAPFFMPSCGAEEDELSDGYCEGEAGIQ